MHLSGLRHLAWAFAWAACAKAASGLVRIGLREEAAAMLRAADACDRQARR